MDVKFYKTMENGVQKSLVDDSFVDQLATWVRQEFLICTFTSGKDEGKSLATTSMAPQGSATTLKDHR